MKNIILTGKRFHREFLASFTIIQHLLYGLLIPLLFLLSLLAWDPKVFVFIFLAYSCGMIGFLVAKAMQNHQQLAEQAEKAISPTDAYQQTVKESIPSSHPLHLGDLMTAHDLKEPLRQVYCYAQLLEKRYLDKLDDNGKEYLAFVLQGAKRMHQMMEDIAALNRIEHEGTNFETIDMSEIVRDTLNTLQLKIKETHALITHDQLPVIQGDPGQLRHLLLNLIGNALKYHGEANPRIHIHVSRVDGNYKIGVQDNGIGIARNQLGEVFELFRRLHSRKKFEGTGIGLAICKRIVENHHGQIGVDSQGEGRGSCFWFTIPMVLPK